MALTPNINLEHAKTLMALTNDTHRVLLWIEDTYNGLLPYYIFCKRNRPHAIKSFQIYKKILNSFTLYSRELCKGNKNAKCHHAISRKTLSKKGAIYLLPFKRHSKCFNHSSSVAAATVSL
ncbi:hypothetical protein CCFV1_ORF075 [Cotesia congregata filamentous virus 1]|uniref:Uncharacterized protein n=1 Tax=Cotesia congregata filamentous virus 1 TaxID=3064291 RepID=A0ABC8QR56_9VIRU|nr:hypothetical protein CCFV1_ORF075 [Cotesia congregata filamentous virus 1]